MKCVAAQILTDAQDTDVGVQHGAVTQHRLLHRSTLPHKLLDASLKVELHSLLLVKLANNTT